MNIQETIEQATFYTSMGVPIVRADLATELLSTQAAEIERLKQDLSAARAALKKHGRHDPLCDRIGYSELQCNCGLEAALAQSGRAEETPTQP